MNEVKQRSTFAVIHDDEFKTLSTDIAEKKEIKNDTVDWQDDWALPPAEEMKHQYRCYQETNDDFPHE